MRAGGLMLNSAEMGRRLKSRCGSLACLPYHAIIIGGRRQAATDERGLTAPSPLIVWSGGGALRDVMPFDL